MRNFHENSLGIQEMISKHPGNLLDTNNPRRMFENIVKALRKVQFSKNSPQSFSRNSNFVKIIPHYQETPNLFPRQTRKLLGKTFARFEAR